MEVIQGHLARGRFSILESVNIWENGKKYWRYKDDMSAITSDPVIKVEDLRTHFQTKWGTVKAVDGVSFEVKRGETLGIVGESGSGKSVTMLSLMRLVQSPPGKIVNGKIFLEGQDILELS